MPLSFTVSGATVEEVIGELKTLMPALLAGKGLPPMQEQPKRDAPEVIPPAKDKKAPKADKKEPVTIDAKVNAEVVDIELVRSKLKTLGNTDGLGHDKVFEVLGKYGAKNASTIPEDKRQVVIDDIDALLKDAK